MHMIGRFVSKNRPTGFEGSVTLSARFSTYYGASLNRSGLKKTRIARLLPLNRNDWKKTRVARFLPLNHTDRKKTRVARFLPVLGTKWEKTRYEPVPHVPDFLTKCREIQGSRFLEIKKKNPETFLEVNLARFHWNRVFAFGSNQIENVFADFLR